MIEQLGNAFALHTEATSYIFCINELGLPEQLYYGKRLKHITEQTLLAMTEKHAHLPGTTIGPDPEHLKLSLEDACLEFSEAGHGDYRDHMLELIHCDGSRSCDFRFKEACLLSEKAEYENLPGSYREDQKAEGLRICLEEAGGLCLELSYYVYEDCDVITRDARLINHSEEPLRLERLLSLQLDLPAGEYTLHSFHGAWGREMARFDQALTAGRVVNAVSRGCSSNQANPFFMVSRGHCGESAGSVYGFNLIYSGNHYESVERNPFGKLRILSGINPETFSMQLEPGESFQAPEAIFSFSDRGFNGLSGHMHAFVREHIVRGLWKRKPRPVLLNSWEANYFHISEANLLRLAKKGKELGIELFVMDDGWFGKRDNDTCSLGDWTVNKSKLPGGLAGISRRIREMGLEFGIWVEPEMVNTDSELYREHPDWTLEIPGRLHSEGRNQRVLDLTKEAVRSYIIESMSRVFEEARVSYVKWDMNRNISDFFSQGQGAETQGDMAHRYIQGLYYCMKTLTERFPRILFEGCASGGNRFDLGILSYFPQIWASDDTDAMCRAEIQNGYSYGYPPSVYSAHVSSCPNHQTLRNTSLDTRFNVAAFSVFGYECNLTEMKKEELEQIREQIRFYKEWREVLQFGRFFRGEEQSGMFAGSFLKKEENNSLCWTAAAPDGSRALGMLLQHHAIPNTQYDCYRAAGLDANAEYRFRNRPVRYNLRDFGDLVNLVSPVHIRQGSLLQSVADKLIHLEGEKEEYVLSGQVLEEAGVKLKQAFGGTGYTPGEVRHFQDFGSRLYTMEKITE